MRTLAATLVASVGLTCLAASEAGAVLIDDFSGTLEVPALDIPQATATALGGIGGSRDIVVQNDALHVMPSIVSINFLGTGVALYGTQNGNTLPATISWDGPDGDPLDLKDEGPGLGPLSLVGGGEDTFRVRLSSASMVGQLHVNVWSSVANASQWTIPLPGTIAAPVNFELPIATFAGAGNDLLGAGADFTMVTAIELVFDPSLGAIGPGATTTVIIDQIDTFELNGNGNGNGHGGEVPEPSALAIWSVLGLLGATLWRRRRHRC